MWRTASSSPGVGRPCPFCHRRMHPVTVEGAPEVDVCVTCQMVWLDRGEGERVPHRGATAAASPPLPMKAREILAIEKAKGIAERAHQGIGAAPPEEWWKFALGIAGFPVEVGGNGQGREWPVATWILAGAITFVSVLAFADLSGAVDRFGLVPADAWRSWGGTLVSSFFLHGGVVHLLGNLYFLLVFGDDAESRLGVSRFLLLMGTAAVGGAALHVVADPGSRIPVIGASAGISGALAFYALSFPRARLAIVGPFWRWIRLPAAAYLGLWLLFQALGAWQQVHGTSSVSYVGHLGGAGVGLVWWLALKVLGAHSRLLSRRVSRIHAQPSVRSALSGPADILKEN